MPLPPRDDRNGVRENEKMNHITNVADYNWKTKAIVTSLKVQATTTTLLLSTLV